MVLRTPGFFVASALALAVAACTAPEPDGLRVVARLVDADLRASGATAPPTRFARMDEFLARTRWIYPGYAEAGAKVERAAQVDTDLKEATEMAARIRTSRPEATDALAELQKRIGALATERGTLAG